MEELWGGTAELNYLCMMFSSANRENKFLGKIALGFQTRWENVINIVLEHYKRKQETFKQISVCS